MQQKSLKDFFKKDKRTKAPLEKVVLHEISDHSDVNGSGESELSDHEDGEEDYIPLRPDPVLYNIDGVKVSFPFEAYPCQQQIMESVTNPILFCQLFLDDSDTQRTEFPCTPGKPHRFGQVNVIAMRSPLMVRAQKAPRRTKCWRDYQCW